ncbi:glutathione S-transferase family protein [Pseudoruegeria sp. HB172150]|uniref:glutathione S-transferase family protein n=1 Tax=Pseudoruegeria sp. HB172150 TaxID=2721164 RepID=UPI001554A514|nr:glutathione S-transferase family protein [Pseudoruegeria sp. HB172150]
MKLYNADLSPNALRVRAVINELDLPVEVVQVDLRSRANKAPEFMEKHPMGKVPVLEDGDFRLWESRAILSYLSALKPEAGLYPDDPKKRALVDQWTYWQTVHLSPVAQKIVFEMVMKPMFGMGDPDPSAVESDREELNSLLALLDSALEGKDWIVGDLSLADFTLASTFVYAAPAGISLDGFPNVAAWWARMGDRPSWQAAVAPLAAIVGG